MAEGDATEPHPEKRFGVTTDVQDAETLICPMKAALLKWALGFKMRAAATTTLCHSNAIGDAPSRAMLRLLSHVQRRLPP